MTITTLTLGSGPAGSSAFLNTGSGTNKLGGTVTFNVVNNPNTATIAGNLDLNGATRTFAVNDSVAAGAAVDLDIPAVIIGGAGFGVTKTGAGAMRLSGANTYDGPTAVTGSLLLGNAQALGLPTAARTNTVAVSSSLALDGVSITDPNSRFTLSLSGTGDPLLGPVSGALVSLAGNNTVPCPIILATASQIASLKAGDTLTLTNNITGAFGLTVDGSGNTEHGGALGTVTTLAKNGAGTLTLSGGAANSHIGLTTVNSGILQLGKTGGAKAIANGGLTINNGGVVTYNGDSTDMMGTGNVIINGSGYLDFNGKSDTIGGTVTITATSATTDTTPIRNTAGGGNLTFGSTLTITPVAGYLSRIDSGTGTNTLGGNVTFTAATTGRARISGNLALGASTRTFTINAGTGPDYDMDIDAVISGGAGVGLTTTTGRLRLSAPNTYAGATTIISGTLKLGASEVIPNGASASNVTVTGTLDLNGFSETINGLSGAGTVDNTVTGTPVLTVGANDQTSTFSGVVKNTAGTLALTKIGAGTLTLSTANTYTGATTNNAGVICVQNATGLGTAAGGVTVAGGAALQLQGAFTIGAEAMTLNGMGISNDGALRHLSGTITNQGAIMLGSASRINADAGTLTLTGGLNGSASGQDLTMGGAGDVTVATAGIGSNVGALTKDGAGTLTVSIGSTNSGTILISGGKLKLGAANVLPSNALTVDGGIFDNNGLAETVGTVTLKSGSIIGAGLLTSSTLSYIVESGTNSAPLGAGAAPLTKNTAGTVTLSGANTYTGITTINAGTLTLGNATALGPAANAKVAFGASSYGVLQLNGTNVTITALNGDDTATVENGAAGAAALTVNSAASDTFAGVLQDGGAGALSLTKGTAGTTLTLSNTNNSYSGLTTVSAGTLKLGASEVIPNGAGKSNVTVTGTLDLNGFSETINGLTGAGTVTNSSGTATVTLGDRDATASATVVIKDGGGTLAVTKIGVGTQTLGGASLYSGGTVVSAGTLKYGVVTAIPSGVGKGNVTVNGTLDLASYSPTINGLTGGGIIDNSTGGATYTLTVGGNNQGGTFSGIIRNTSGAVALTKTGTGTLTLTGTNAYGGLTTISGGAY